ncbi:hypothetical protein RND81_05G054400 [Saponaria officinalis]|uniref:Uncharacterized protein n=1 Tax=Saponaria officinalis TaxID=3572 RepID=A0AAW1KTI3_SAPOF
MMTSSGSGLCRVGGLGPLSSSLSSNLSPLAPPFEVDKSLQKQNSTNTSVNYSDVLMYGPYFDPAGQLWNHFSSSASGSKFAATEPMGVNATCSSSPTIYGYSGSQPSTTPSNVYAAASGSSAAYDPFSYDPFPKSMPAAPKEDVKPYFSPFMSSPPQKDGFLSLGVSSGDDLDMLSNSANHPQQTLWDGDHKLSWGGFWSGGNGQRKWSEYDQGFVSKDSNLSDATSSKSTFIVDGSNKSQPCIDVRTHPFVERIRNNNVPDACNRSSPGQGLGLTSPVSDGCFDIFGAAYHPGSLGIGQLDSRPLLGCTRLPIYVSSSIPEEKSNLQDPVVESVTNSCGSQTFNGWSCKDHFSQSGGYAFGCTSTASTFPITKNKSPYGEKSSSAGGTFSATKPDSKVSDANEDSNICARYDYSYPVELQIPLGSTRQLSIIRRPSSTSVATSSSQIGESLDSRSGNKVSKKSQVSPQRLFQFSSDGQNAEKLYIEKLSEGTDVHNPAEDSPCWRGASSSSFSPFTLSKFMVPDALADKLDECKSVSMHAPQIKSFPVDTSDSEAFFSDKVKERKSSEGPLVRECVSKGTEERYSTNLQPLCFDLNIGDGLLLTDKSNTFTKDHCVLNKSETDSFPEIQISETTACERGDKCLPVMSNNSPDVPTSSENHESSPLGDNASLKPIQDTTKISDLNINADMLLNTLSDLSEMLRCYCFSKRTSIPQQYSIAIKHIIANLDSSMLMMAGKTSSATPSEVISTKKEVPLPQMVNDTAFETIAEGLLESVSCKDDPNTIGDVDTTVAIKKILHENFLGKEEMDQQKLLYKRLWLDAEASLCAMTAKARFLRVKADMEKTLDGAKDKEISSSSNMSGDVHGTVGLASQKNHAKVSDVNKRHIPDTQGADVNTMKFEGAKATEEETPFLSSNASRKGNAGNDSVDSGSTSHAKDVEDSVMARYQILKGRIECSVASIQENEESSGGHKNPSYMHASGFDSNNTETTSDSMGDDNPVMDKCQLLKCRVDHGSLNSEHNDLSNRDPSCHITPIYQILECGDENSDSLHEGRDFENFHWLSKSIGDTEEGRGSVMARFRIIQSRIQDSDSVDKSHIVGFAPRVVEDDRDELGFSEKQNQAMRSAIGPYQYVTKDNHVNQFGFLEPILRETELTQRGKTNRLNTEILESWYGNDCSSPDWGTCFKGGSPKSKLTPSFLRLKNDESTIFLWDC